MKRTRPIEFVKEEDAGNNMEPEREIETPKALLNDVVLQNIFKYLGFKDLKSCRDVGNRTWLRNLKKAWWSRTKVVFGRTTDGIGRLTRYLNEYAITSNATNYQFERSIRYHSRFWSILGHSIKYLELRECSFSTVDTFRSLIYTQCPNLESLVGCDIKIKNVPNVVEPKKWQEPQYGQQSNLKSLKIFRVLPVPWMEFLSHFPNLQDLEAHVNNADIFNPISIIRQHDPKMLKLKHIKVHISSRRTYEEPISSVYLDPGLRLETMQIIGGSCRPETIIEILDFHAQSVKELHIEGGGFRIPIKITLQQPLHNLEKLTISDCRFTADIFKYTPNLKTFRVYFYGAHGLLSIDRNLKMTTCKKLVLRDDGRCHDNLTFFLHTFPDVEHLVVSRLSNWTFSRICEHWTKLVTVRVLEENEVTIDGLLGFDPHSKNETARKPNITNLKDLQTFVLQRFWTKHAAEGDIKEIYLSMGEIILRELATLPRLQKFDFTGNGGSYENVWKMILEKYPGTNDKKLTAV